MNNGLQQRYRTFGECLTELKARLGFVAQQRQIDDLTGRVYGPHLLK